MREKVELDQAIGLAQQLFGLNSFYRVDPVNVRIGPYWLGYHAESREWRVWECGRGGEPRLEDATWLDEALTAAEAMGCLVGIYTCHAYLDAVQAGRHTAFTPPSEVA